MKVLDFVSDSYIYIKKKYEVMDSIFKILVIQQKQ